MAITTNLGFGVIYLPVGAEAKDQVDLRHGVFQSSRYVALILLINVYVDLKNILVRKEKEQKERRKTTDRHNERKKERNDIHSFIGVSRSLLATLP